MDIFSMLQNATVFDAETDEAICQIVGFEVANGRIFFNAVLFGEEIDGPDDGDKEEIPEPSKAPLRVIAGDRLSG